MTRVRRRASTLALQQRALIVTKLSKGSSFDYWRFLSEQDSAADMEPPPAEFLARGAQQLDFMKTLGLQPHHTVLDYGCSVLRTGLHFVPYLQQGNYVGADVATTALRIGVKLMAREGIDRRRYHLVALRSPELTELDGFTFDYVFSDSVLQYLPDEELRRVFTSVRRLLRPSTGMLYATFPDTEWKDVLARKRNFYRSPERMGDLARAAGFDADVRPKAASGFPRAPHLILTHRAA